MPEGAPRCPKPSVITQSAEKVILGYRGNKHTQAPCSEKDLFSSRIIPRVLRVVGIRGKHVWNIEDRLRRSVTTD